MSSLSCLTFVLSSLIVHGSLLQLLIYNAHICTLELGIHVNCLSALHLNITVSLFFCRSLPCLLWWDFWRISFYNMSSSSPLYPSIFGGWRWEIQNSMCLNNILFYTCYTSYTSNIGHNALGLNTDIISWDKKISVYLYTCIIYIFRVTVRYIYITA